MNEFLAATVYMNIRRAIKIYLILLMEGQSICILLFKAPTLTTQNKTSNSVFIIS